MRICLFVSLAIFGILPLLHGTHLVGTEVALKPVGEIFVFYIILMIGLTCYFTKFPEKFFPNKFDYFVSNLLIKLNNITNINQKR